MFPVGILPMTSRLWCSYPGLVQRTCRAPTMRTIGEAVIFHRAGVRDHGTLIRCRVQVHSLTSRADLNETYGVVVSLNSETGRYDVLLGESDGVTVATVALRPECICQVAFDGDKSVQVVGPTKAATIMWRAHTYGLANALWETEVLQNVEEACTLAIGERLLADDFEDKDFVRHFMLDLYLELGKWDAALELLHRHGASGGAAEERITDSQTLWAWTVALIQLKKHGLKNTKTKAAIQAAIGVNPSVAEQG